MCCFLSLGHTWFPFHYQWWCRQVMSTSHSTVNSLCQPLPNLFLLSEGAFTSEDNFKQKTKSWRRRSGAPLSLTLAVTVGTVHPWGAMIYYAIELPFKHTETKVVMHKRVDTFPLPIRDNTADSWCAFDSKVNYSSFSEKVLRDQADRSDSGQVYSIIHSVPCPLHVVLISSLGAGALMTCAEVVSRELERYSNATNLKQLSVTVGLWFLHGMLRGQKCLSLNILTCRN